MITFNGINHLAFVTNDMDTTIRFWRDLLGMRLVGGIGNSKFRQYFFELSQNDMIAFFQWNTAEKIPLKDHGVPVSGPFAFDHVSFGVDSDLSLWELKDRLEAADFWVSEMIDHGFIHSIYTFDPNNIPIEFSFSIKRVDLRKHPRMVDKQCPPSAQEGPEPHSDYWPAVREPTPEAEKFIFPGEGIALAEQTDDDDYT